MENIITYKIKQKQNKRKKSTISKENEANISFGTILGGPQKFYQIKI